MRRALPLTLAFLTLALAACDSPAPQMLGAERTEVSRDGRDYVVYRKGNQVEVIRMGMAGWGDHQGIRAAMIAVVPEATGCSLVPSSVRGDSGEMRGRLSC
jgi:hypothetical protein